MQWLSCCALSCNNNAVVVDVFRDIIVSSISIVYLLVIVVPKYHQLAMLSQYHYLGRFSWRFRGVFAA